MAEQKAQKEYIIFASNNELGQRYMASNKLSPVHQFGHAVFVATKDDDGVVPQSNMIASVYDADDETHRSYLTKRAALTDNERLLVAAWLRNRTQGDKDASRSHNSVNWGTPPRP